MRVVWLVFRLCFAFKYIIALFDVCLSAALWLGATLAISPRRQAIQVLRVRSPVRNVTPSQQSHGDAHRHPRPLLPRLQQALCADVFAQATHADASACRREHRSRQFRGWCVGRWWMRAVDRRNGSAAVAELRRLRQDIQLAADAEATSLPAECRMLATNAAGRRRGVRIPAGAPVPRLRCGVSHHATADWPRVWRTPRQADQAARVSRLWQDLRASVLAQAASRGARRRGARLSDVREEIRSAVRAQPPPQESPHCRRVQPTGGSSNCRRPRKLRDDGLRGSSSVGQCCDAAGRAVQLLVSSACQVHGAAGCTHGSGRSSRVPRRTSSEAGRRQTVRICTVTGCQFCIGGTHGRTFDDHCVYCRRVKNWLVDPQTSDPTD